MVKLFKLYLISYLSRIYLIGLMCCAMLSACTNNNQKNDTPAVQQKSESTAGFTMQDTASAKVIQINPKDSLKLKYAPAPGDVFCYKISQLEINDFANEFTGKQLLEFFYTKKVKFIKPDGNAVCALRFDSIRIFIRGPNMDSSKINEKYKEIKYNSNDSASRNNPKFAQVNMVVGETVEVTISQDGELTSIDSVNKIVDKIFKYPGVNPRPEDRPDITKNVKFMSFQMPLQNELLRYPPKPLDSARNWKYRYESVLLGMFPTKNDITYTLKQIKEMNGRKVAEIVAVAVTKVLSTKKDGPNGVDYVELKNSKITGSGKNLIDYEKGFSIYRESTISSYADWEFVNVKSKFRKGTKQTLTTTITTELLSFRHETQN